jgi:hypothetical protein
MPDLLVGPEGLPHSRVFNDLPKTETKGNADVSRYLSQPTVSVVERDDGLWSIGWDDNAPGPFESRSFAEAVAARRAA